jgi:hypothetical protein
MRIGNIISTFVKNNQIFAQIGEWFGGKSEIFYETPLLQNYGFCSRPKPATNEGSCDCVSIGHGSQEIIVGTNDHRANTAIGELMEGDTAIYSQVKEDSAAIVKTTSEGSIYMVAPTDHDTSGSPKKSHSIILDAETKLVVIAHENGPKIIMDKDNIILNNGSCGITITSDKIFLSGQVVGTSLNVAGQLIVTGTAPGTLTVAPSTLQVL